jgi:N utilization substance protein B
MGNGLRLLWTLIHQGVSILSRRLAREVALRSLFQIDAGHNTAEEALEYNIKELAASSQSGTYARQLVQRTLEHLSAIDQVIERHSHDWSLKRLVGTDKAILRIAVCELEYLDEKLAAQIVINEAVELAKMYGNDTSGRFVNGVLSGYLRDQQGSRDEK